MVKDIEEFSAEFQLFLFTEGDLSLQGHVSLAQGRAAQGVAPDVAETEGRRKGKGCSVEPVIGVALISREVRRDTRDDAGPHRIDIEQRTSIRNVSKDTDGEGEAALCLIDGRDLPVS